MKIIASTIRGLALSFIAGTVAPAAAYSGSLIERLDSDPRGGHAGQFAPQKAEITVRVGVTPTRTSLS